MTGIPSVPANTGSVFSAQVGSPAAKGPTCIIKLSFSPAKYLPLDELSRHSALCSGAVRCINPSHTATSPILSEVML